MAMRDKLELKEILKNSEAFKSLQTEQAVADVLSRLGWHATQSPYYLDEKTGKSRELDVIAKRYWKAPRKSGDLTARVNVFVEVKSNSDFHILCAGPASQPYSFGNNEYWVGYSEPARRKVEDQLGRFGLERAAVLKFLHKMERATFPKRRMRTSTLRIKPPPAENCFSAFRETNGKTEKDLDNSVLWRATSAVRSAVMSAQRELIDGLMLDLGMSLEISLRMEELPEEAVGTIERHSHTINIYLPVVVIQSRIWSVLPQGPHEIKWARLIQYGTYGDSQDWVDVVNMDNVEEYFSGLNEYLERTFRKVRAKTWP